MKHHIKRAARIVSGWIFLLLGFAGLFLPLLQGILFLTIGAFLLAPYVRSFRKLQYLLCKRFPHARGFIKRMRAKNRLRSAG